MTNEIKPHKVLTPTEMLETLDAIRDLQAEVICHVKTWLHHPRPEVDERFIAARQREAKMLEQIMVFDRRAWNKGRTPADEALLKAEALTKKRKRRRADQAIQRRHHDDQPEGEGL
jgi:hypothetical protein